MRLLEFLNEAYSNELMWLIRYLKERDIDHYQFWYAFLEWANDNDYDDWVVEFAKTQGIEPEQIEEDPELFHKIPEEMQKEFIEHIKNDLLDGMMRHNPTETPTWMHMDLDKDKPLPRETWLVHFSDNADAVAKQGFKKGVYDMTTLGLTTYMRPHNKQYGGYNFALIADSRDARWVRKQKKYGDHAVLFQSSGVRTHHYGDEENQIIFYGPRVNPKTSFGSTGTTRMTTRSCGTRARKVFVPCSRASIGPAWRGSRRTSVNTSG